MSAVFPREGKIGKRTFKNRASNFFQKIARSFRPKGITNALNNVNTQRAKENKREVPKVGFGPGGLLGRLPDKYISAETDGEPATEDSLKLTRNTDIREQNRFRRVMALLDEKNFESFFGFSDMDVEQDPRKRSPPRVIIEDYERLLTTRKRYGNNSDESEDEIIEAYNDLLFMILQLLFLACFYILHDLLLGEIYSKIRTMENGIQQNKLIEIQDKIRKTIKEADKITQFSNRVYAASRKDWYIYLIGMTVGILATIPVVGLVFGMGGIGAAIVISSMVGGGISPIILLKLFRLVDNQTKAENKQKLQLYMYATALHKLFQVVFNTENKIPFEMLKDERKIDWGIFNKSQIEFIIKRTPSKIIRNLRKEPECPICEKCINPNNYYDNPSGQTNEESQTNEEKEKEAECKSGENRVYFDKKAEQLLCGHRFHTECIDQWIKLENSKGRWADCPVCIGPLYRHTDFDYADKSFDLNPASPINVKLTVSVRANAALKQGTDGMTEIMFLTFLTHLLNLYYEPGKIRVFNSEVPIEELGKTPNKPPLIARPFTHKPKSANKRGMPTENGVIINSISGMPNSEGAFANFRNSKGFGRENMREVPNSALSLRAPEGGKRRTRKYKKAH